MANPQPDVNSGEDRRAELVGALGAAFAEFTCPPLPYVNSSFQEWADAVLSVVGPEMTLSQLAQLSKSQKSVLAQKFADRFQCKAPKVVQIETAIAHTLALLKWSRGASGDATSADGPPATPPPPEGSLPA